MAEEKSIEEMGMTIKRPMEVPEIVAARVRDARRRKELSQEALGAALARYLGKPWSKQVVSAVERGQRDLAATELLAFAFVLGETVAGLMAPEVGQEVVFAKGRVRGVDVRRATMGDPEAGPLSGIVKDLNRAVSSIATYHRLAEMATEALSRVAGKEEG